jgi:hypothetical protein
MGRNFPLIFGILLTATLSACGGGGGGGPVANNSAAQPAYGPRIPVGPQASITCAPNSVTVSPGQNIEAIVSTHTAGTTYCLSAGTFSRQTITPHSGDTFIGLQGAILDGQNATQYAFSNYYAGSSVTNVTIENLVIRNYNSPVQTASVFGDGSGNTGWSILNNEIASGGAIGVYAQSGWSIVGNYIHNNAQGGYFASGSGITITDNDIAYNDPNNAFDFNVNGCGGGKIYKSSDVDISYNYSHNNVGPGLWTDTDNEGTTYTHNDVEYNSRNGIMHEISWDATIQSNYLHDDGNSTSCGAGTGANFYCPEIFISNSGGERGTTVDVSANTIVMSDYGAGIGLFNIARGSGIFGPWLVQNVHVHNNTIQLSQNVASPGGTFGAIDDDGSDPAMLTSQGNGFDYDSFVGATSNSFYWGPGKFAGSATNFAGFQRDGQELHGTSRS